jgi:ABC-2 type transport system permease protein
MILPTYRTEMSKQFRRARTWAAFAVVVVLPLLITFAVRFGERRRRFREEPFNPFVLARSTGLIMPAAALLFMSSLPLLPIVIALFAGDSVAGEAGSGNLRYVLVRPIGRARLLAAKLGMAVTMAIIATLLIVVAGLIAGTIAFGWHRIDISLDFSTFGGPNVSLHKSQLELLKDLGIATAYVAWGMAFVVAFAFMLSVMTDSGAAAIFGGFGLFMVSQILDAIPQLEGLKPGFPTHYLNNWSALIDPTKGGTEMLHGVLVQIPYVVVFLGIAFWWFRRKDILS